ncbi:MAG: ribonuclease J [Bradymonadales bacterium]|nr:ribonuclease J [Bradymonadales bacterium]
MSQQNQRNRTGELSGTEEPVRIIPLGGTGEIGMNCTVYEASGKILIVDCGVNFPKEKAYGIDLIIPSFNYLVENRDKVVGLVLTHGHEDHIGAVPYLLREINPPIYAAPFALELIKRKLREHGLYEHAKLNEVTAGDELSIGPFSVEFIHVNHSIPQSCNLAVRTAAGTIVHASDFKVEWMPRDEEPIDLSRFAALGDQGVLCLLSDSTNVFEPGHGESERTVAKNLADLVKSAKGRVIVTLFASNLYRVQTLLHIAHQNGRRVLVLGRSLHQIMEIGQLLGLLNLPDDLLVIQQEDLEAYRHDQLLVLTTGSQGEPRSALTQIAMDDHPWFSILPGDYVVFSSRVIPGNQVAVDRICDHLYRRGARVFRHPQYGVHASGHACQSDQQLLISLVKPLFFVPVHGEYRHLARHAELAEELGVEEAFILENGDVLSLWEDEARRTGTVTAGRVIVDGKGLDEASGVALRDRKKLARGGIVVAWLVLDASSGEVVFGPRLLTQGVVGADPGQDLIEEAVQEALRAIQALNVASRRETAEVGEALRIAVRKVFHRRIENKPVVVPVVYEL